MRVTNTLFAWDDYAVDFIQQVRRMGDEENEEEQEEEQPETRIEVEIPRIVTSLGRTLHYVKLPNFLSVETR